MGILDSLIGNLLGGSHSSSSGLGGVLSSILGGGQREDADERGGGGGGLGGLLNQFQRAGYGDKVQSWIGRGDNDPVSPDELQDVFGRERVHDMARQADMEPGDFLSQLSHHLPRAVDGMTPDGRLPDDDRDMSV